MNVPLDRQFSQKCFKSSSWDDYLFALLLQMKPGPFVPIKDEEDFAVLHWDIRMHRNTTQKSENALKSYKIATKFSIAQDTAYTIVPVASVSSSIKKARTRRSPE